MAGHPVFAPPAEPAAPMWRAGSLFKWTRDRNRLLAIECTAAQARDLAASGVVASMQVDRVATTQQ